MYFNFDDRQPDIERIEGAISWREGALRSLAAHALCILAILKLPEVLPGIFAALAPDPSALEQRMAAMREQESNDRRFVFVQPRAEFEAQRPPQNPELSDRDRSITTPYERTPEPTNPLPYSRGNTTERVDQPGTPEGPKPADKPGESGSDAKEPGSPAPGPPTTETREIDDPVIRGLRGPKPQAQSGNNGTGTGGGLANALRDVNRYVSEQVFNNPQGGGQFGDTIQFDTKGVEFGPWVRRFLAQVRRNWFIPYAAMSLRGHVSVSFNVHKNGSISDIAVVGSTGIEAFNNSSFNAIAASNPTLPLPPEYPAEQAFITITFYYNETPPSR